MLSFQTKAPQTKAPLTQVLGAVASVLTASVLTAGVLASSALAQGVGQVETSVLGDVDPLLIGTLTPQEGGLPRSLWNGSDALGVADAARRMPGETASRAAAQLAARVLSSPGFSPGGAGDSRTAAAARAGALLALGQVDVVDAIITQTPRGLDEPELAVLAVRARLAQNEITPACRVGDALTNGRDGGFWLRLRTACYAWAGEGSAAQLTLDLARESDAAIADEGFATWVFAASNGAAPRNAPAPRDALEATLARSAGALIQGDILDGLPLLVAVGVARDTDASPEARAEAALRAARAGALTTVEFAEALDALAPADGTSMSELLEQGRGDASLRGFALLRQAALSNDGGPFIAAEALDAALARASSPVEFVVFSEALSDALVAIPASPELVRNAAVFARASAAIGDVEQAHAWLNPTSQEMAPPSGFDTGLAFDGFAPAFSSAPDFSGSPLEPVARLDAEVLAAAVNARATPGYLASVASARLASTLSEDDVVRAAARRDALILLALGAETSPSLRRAAVSAASEVEPVSGAAAQALTAARLAAQAGAVGEAALYVAQAVGEAGPGHAPTAAFAIEIALALGLDDDARAIAVEALLVTRVASADGDDE